MLHSLHNYVFIFEHVNVIDLACILNIEPTRRLLPLHLIPYLFRLWLPPLHTSSKTTLPIGTVSVRGCHSRIWRDQKPVLERTALLLR